MGPVDDGDAAADAVGDDEGLVVGGDAGEAGLLRRLRWWRSRLRASRSRTETVLEPELAT